MFIAQLSDTLCPVSWRARPGSFVSLMTLYESNYIRLRGLAPDVAQLEGESISQVSGDCPLHLQVLEHCRYTSTIRLTYIFENEAGFEDEAGVVADPDLQIRVYHDARLAEVLQCARWHRHRVLNLIHTQLARDLGDRWLRNVMLNKWLDYCVERGHRFSAPLAP